MEFGAEPPVGDSSRFRLLHEHPQIALVGLLFDRVSVDALGHLLRPDTRLGARIGLTALAHFERVSLWLKSNELDDRMALRLGLEITRLCLCSDRLGSQVRWGSLPGFR